MKRPYLNQLTRQICDTDTFWGKQLRLHLEWMKLRRELDKNIKSVFEWATKNSKSKSRS